MHKVYIVTNLINGKIYIGKTSKTIEERWKTHQYKVNSDKRTFHFWSALRKYGFDAFSIHHLANVESNEDAIELEKLYIRLYGSYKREIGYNSTFGGEGVIPTLETRIKNGSARKGRKFSEETKRKMSLSRMGRKGYWTGVTGANNPNFGMKRSSETKAKQRALKLGKPWTEARRAAYLKSS